MQVRFYLFNGECWALSKMTFFQAPSSQTFPLSQPSLQLVSSCGCRCWRFAEAAPGTAPPHSGGDSLCKRLCTLGCAESLEAFQPAQALGVFRWRQTEVEGAPSNDLCCIAAAAKVCENWWDSSQKSDPPKDVMHQVRPECQKASLETYGSRGQTCSGVDRL